MDWIFAHAFELWALATALHSAALIIVNLTPSPRDNDCLAKAYTVVEWAAGLFTKKVKE